MTVSCSSRTALKSWMICSELSKVVRKSSFDFTSSCSARFRAVMSLKTTATRWLPSPPTREAYDEIQRSTPGGR